MQERGLPATAISTLRSALVESKADTNMKAMSDAKPEVLERYGPVFSLENLEKLSRETFLGFLRFSNNQHWKMLAFYGPKMCSDMGKLQGALHILLDESKPPVTRLDQLVPKGEPPMVPGLNRATLTAILLVSHPDKYGVWNQTTETAMETVGLWPTFNKGASFGQRYAIVNDILVKTSQELDTDLWTLDGLWWWLLPDKPDSEGPDPPTEPPGVDSGSSGDISFGLERHLHEFLRDNWAKTSLGRDWSLYSKDGEIVGYQYVCPAGKIDLLAHHKKEKSWLVIELKRGQGSDDTVGQVMRYMGWVKAELAAADEGVEGLIIAHSDDAKIRYAITIAPSVRMMLYEVDFRLVPPSEDNRD